MLFLAYIGPGPGFLLDFHGPWPYVLITAATWGAAWLIGLRVLTAQRRSNKPRTAPVEGASGPFQLSAPMKRLRRGAFVLFAVCLVLQVVFLVRSNEEATRTQHELDAIQQAQAAGEPGVSERLHALSEARSGSNSSSQMLIGVLMLSAAGTIAVVSMAGLLKGAQSKW